MTWFDIVAPKDVLFFRKIIDELESRGEKVLITAREAEGYSEVVELLRLYNIPFINLGAFGGGQLKDKLKASIERQKELMEFIADHDISRLVCLCSVDANRIAFGLGINIINFYDIPLSDYQENFKRALPQARLTLPLSSKVIKPFVVPDEIFRRFSLENEQIYNYSFIDPLIWLEDFIYDSNYVDRILDQFAMDRTRPLIVMREEEYKASYVAKQFPLLYDAMKELSLLGNIVIIPRYEANYLKTLFPYAYVLDEKVIIQHLLKACDLFIGGGGTINTEACYFGTPTISTRSFVSHYDKYQIDTDLMKWVTTKEELLASAEEMIGKRKDEKAKAVFSTMSVDIPLIVDIILKVEAK